MTKKLICQIQSPPMHCEIEVGSGLLDRQGEYLSTLGSQCAIIADDQTAQLYGEKLRASLRPHGMKTYLFTFPHGEHSKTRETKEKLENHLFEEGLGRDTCIVALGGGVATDIGGYLAATYCRGIPLVMVPTSLLAMVDASIGGKTGINVPYGKNMIGCIYQPKKVIIDPDTLKTLPENELSNGAVEMIKHGLIADQTYFERLEKHSGQFFSLNSPFIEQAILDSCRIKKEVVEQDERDSGKRHLLNFGHTVGHALETLTGYALPHGEAVAIGLLVEGYLSRKLGMLPENSLKRIWEVLKAYRLSLKLPTSFPVKSVMEAMSLDKKSLKGLPRFVLLEEIGKPLCNGSTYCFHVEESLLREALEIIERAGTQSLPFFNP